MLIWAMVGCHSTAVDGKNEDERDGRGDSGTGQNDTGCAVVLWYADRDGDGWGNADDPIEACFDRPGLSGTPGDCDDGRADVHPEAPESCDEIDNDCDAVVDEDVIPTWFADLDHDGHGDPSTGVAVCSRPPGHVATGDDCNDFNPDINPTAEDACRDGLDSDCDGADEVACYPRSGPLPDIAEWFPGVTAGDSASAVTGLGDVNGDGFDDFAVGALGNDDGGADAGAAFLVLGRLGITGGSLAGADATYTGARADDRASTVTGPGDVNGDGLHDLVVGSPNAGQEAGAVALILGRDAPVDGSLQHADATIIGTRPGQVVGDAVAGLGDFNGDGFADYIVGSYHDYDTIDAGGAAYVVLGSATPGDGKLPDVGIALVGRGPKYSTATTVAGVGDVDGDGLDDAAVNSLAAKGPWLAASEACLVLGAARAEDRALDDADATLTGAKSDGPLIAIASAGDVDGDGLDDMLFGLPYANRGAPWAGAAHLVLGTVAPASASLGEADAIFLGEGPGDAAGWALSSAGDVDADGHDDLVVGAPAHDNSDGTAGAAYLVRGAPVVPTGSLGLARAVYQPGGRDAGLVGTHLSPAGDIDSDGYGDILLGSVGDDGAGQDAGAAFLLLGGP